MINQEELLANFVEESQQHLQGIEPDLLEIEKEKANNLDEQVLNRVFRAVHSVKGAAGFFGLHKIGELSHVMENLLSLMRDKKLEPSSDLIDALLMGIDTVKTMVDDVKGSNDFNIKKDVERLTVFLNNKDKKDKKITVYEKLPTDISKIREPRKFELSESKIEKFIKKDIYLYSVQIFLKADLTIKNKTPYDFINDISLIGEFIESFLDIKGISDLSDCLNADLSFIFLFATIIEPDLISTGLQIPEERIMPIDIEQNRNKHKQKIVSSFGLMKSPKNKEIIEKKEEVNISITDDDKAEKIETSKPTVTTSSDKTTQKQSHADDKIRVGVNFLNDLVNLAGELVLGRNQLMQVALTRAKDIPGLNPVLQLISRITTEMQGKIMQMRMQPVSLLFGRFQRIVRDLAKSLDKEIKLITFGEDVELDKTIIEALSDPLTHLIRNSVDHGIEMPDAREKAGKTRQGTIEIKAYHQAGQVYIEVLDDGAGINAKKISEKALEKRIITSEQLNSMTEREKIRLIFSPGFSTAEQVTSVSGRGVGMDVVVTNIEKIGGTVDIETSVGKGTNMRLILPLTLAIVSGLVVKTANQSFIIPEANIEELVRITPSEITEKINIIQNALVLRLREMLLPIINLKKILNLTNGNETDILKEKEKPIRVIVTRHGSFRQGIIVDSLENIEEIVVKPLPRYLKKMKYFSGASIMGNGTVSLILDVGGLVEKAKLQHIDAELESEKYKEEKVAIRGETQTLLLFDNKTEEQFALPLELITRIEKVNLSEIEHIRDNQYLQYQGKKLKLMYLEDYLPINRPKRTKEDSLGIIIPKQMKYPLGIVIHKIIGTINAEVELDTETIMAPGLFGSAVLNNKIVLLPDMYKLFELASPELYGSIDASKKKKDKYKILLVDDTAFFRMVESEYLSSAGYEVIQAENGKKAITILEEQSVDAVILDIIMPGLTGWDVIKTLRNEKRWKNLPVMAVTSLGDEELAVKGKDAGFNDWETKLNKTRLLEKLGALLKK